MLNLDKVIPRTKLEIKQQQKLQRIKHCENLRKERFFNAKNRLMGKDIQAIQKQIDEKVMLKQMQKDEEETYYKKLLYDIQVADNLEHRTNEIKKQVARDIDVYRLTEQRKQLSREYDLNDPKSICNQMPMRLPEGYDPREFTKSSFLTFNSEDYNGEKEKAMKKHLWQSLAAQITENVKNRNNYKLSHLQIGKETMRLDAITNEAIKLEEEIKAQIAKGTMEYNLRKADYEREKKKIEKDKEYEDGVAHICTCLNSDFYSENPSQAQSSLGLKRLVGYCYKGMSDEEKREIKEIQLKQIEEIKERRNIEKANEKYWIEVEDLQTNLKFVRQQLDISKQKDINRKIFEENTKLAAEQAVQREVMKKMATDNFPTNEFFDAFNTTSR